MYRAEDHERDLPIGADLVGGEVLVRLDQRRPEALTFLRGGETRPHLPPLAADLHGRDRVGTEVEVPGGVVAHPSERRDDDEVVAGREVHEGDGARTPG